MHWRENRGFRRCCTNPPKQKGRVNTWCAINVHHLFLPFLLPHVWVFQKTTTQFSAFLRVYMAHIILHGRTYHSTYIFFLYFSDIYMFFFQVYTLSEGVSYHFFLALARYSQPTCCFQRTWLREELREEERPVCSTLGEESGYFLCAISEVVCF